MRARDRRSELSPSRVERCRSNAPVTSLATDAEAGGAGGPRTPPHRPHDRRSCHSLPPQDPRLLRLELGFGGDAALHEARRAASAARRVPAARGSCRSRLRCGGRRCSAGLRGPPFPAGAVAHVHAPSSRRPPWRLCPAGPSSYLVSCVNILWLRGVEKPRSALALHRPFCQQVRPGALPASQNLEHQSSSAREACRDAPAVGRAPKQTRAPASRMSEEAPSNTDMSKTVRGSERRRLNSAHALRGASRTRDRAHGSPSARQAREQFPKTFGSYDPGREPRKITRCAPRSSPIKRHRTTPFTLSFSRQPGRTSV